MKRIRTVALSLAALLGAATSCIEPPLNLPNEELLTEMPVVQVDMNVVWGMETDWKAEWYYGWDEADRQLSGDTCYTMPTNYEIRRYYLGEQENGAHTRDGMDGFTVFGNSFRRNYQFGYYDMLLWSNIDSSDGTQVLLINESQLDSITATTTATRGMIRSRENSSVVALYNQPEIFYSAYERNIYISRNSADYDYFDETEKVWVKKLQTTLKPLVYIYLVQVILHNNDGRVTGITGDASISAMASGATVNSRHTNNSPCMVYFPMRMKKELDVNGETVDIAGGKLTTFGLCDMAGYEPQSRTQYEGSRTDVDNNLYFTLRFSNGTEKTYNYLVTDQCRAHCHGGVITIHIDCSQLTPPIPEWQGDGNIFVPTVEDYEHVDYDILM